MSNNDDAEMRRLCELHDRWAVQVDALIAEGNDPVEIVEAMMTIATASMLKLVGNGRTAHALLSAYGPIRGAMKEAQPTMMRGH